MFKIGDIVVGNVSGKIAVVTGINGIRYLSESVGRKVKNSTVDAMDFKPYTGPEYKKAEKRFVPSKEWRFPERGEWFVGKDPRGGREVVPLQNGYDGISVGTGGVSMGYKPILLLVPEVEPTLKVGDEFTFEGQIYAYKGAYRPVQKGDVYIRFPSSFEYKIIEQYDKGQGAIKRAEACNTIHKDYILEPQIDPFLDGAREITDEDLISPAHEMVVRCKAVCCSPRDGSAVFYDQLNDKGEIIPWREGIVTFRVRPEGHILHYHEGNDSPFAKMYSSEMSWKVEWLIPKEDIRVVGKSLWDTTSNTTT